LKAGCDLHPRIYSVEEPGWLQAANILITRAATPEWTLIFTIDSRTSHWYWEPSEP